MVFRLRKLTGKATLVAGILVGGGISGTALGAQQTGEPADSSSAPAPNAGGRQTSPIERVGPTCPRAKTALILAGGGAKGAAHIGVIRVLDSLGIVPDLVVGTSIGAIVGALYSSGYSGAEIDSLTRLYPLGSLVRAYQPRLPQSVGVGLSPSIVWQSRTSDWVMQSGAIRESDVHAIINALMLRGNLIARGNFDSLPIPFRAVATDLADRKTVVLSQGDLARAVRASFSIPMVFEPMHLNGDVLVDGGVSNNVPIGVARELGAQRVIVSMLNGEVMDTGNVGSTISTASKLIDFLFLQPLDSLGPTDILIRSELTQYGLLDFAPKRLAEIARIGYRNAVQAFASAECLPGRGVKHEVVVPDVFRGLLPHPNEETLAPVVPAQFGVRASRSINEDSVRTAIARIARSDLYEGVWLNPLRDSTDPHRVSFRPLFVHRPRQSVGVGFAYITSLGGRLWLGAYRRGPDLGRDELTALLDISEFRQRLEVSVHRLIRIGSVTMVPVVRLTAAREQVRLYLPGIAMLPANEVREGAAFFGLERTVVRNLRYRWGLVARTWAPEGEPALGSAGVRALVTMMNSNEAPVMELDAEANTRYRRVSFDARTTRRARSWAITPKLHGGVGQQLPTYRTFAFGGLEGFPGFRSFEVRGSSELLVSVVAQRKFWGPFSWRIEPVAGWVNEQDSVRKALFLVGHGRLAGLRAGVEVTTPLGPLRVEYGINSLHRRQAGFIAGVWK